MNSVFDCGGPFAVGRLYRSNWYANKRNKFYWVCNCFWEFGVLIFFFLRCNACVGGWLILMHEHRSAISHLETQKWYLLGLDRGVLRKWKPKHGKKVVTAERYKDQNGKLRYKGTSSLKSTEKHGVQKKVGVLCFVFCSGTPTPNPLPATNPGSTRCLLREQLWIKSRRWRHPAKANLSYQRIFLVLSIPLPPWIGMRVSATSLQGLRNSTITWGDAKPFKFQRHGSLFFQRNCKSWGTMGSRKRLYTCWYSFKKKQTFWLLVFLPFKAFLTCDFQHFVKKVRV